MNCKGCGKELAPLAKYCDSNCMAKYIAKLEAKANSLTEEEACADRNTKWYVVRFEGGKFADGYYGSDCHIHSPEQIFSEDTLPYSWGTNRMEFIEVGQGQRKPTVEQARALLNKENYNAP